MRKLFIILIGLIAVVNFIRAYDNHNSVKMEIQTKVSKNTSFEVFSEDQSLTE